MPTNGVNVVIGSCGPCFMFSECSFKYLFTGYEWADRKKQQSLWWTSEPGGFLTPPQKIYSFIYWTKLDMAISVKRWERDSLFISSPPLVLILSLFCLFSTRIRCWQSDFHSPFLIQFCVWECFNSWWTQGKEQKGREKKANRKATKV